MWSLSFLAVLCAVLSALALADNDYPAPPPTFEAKKFTTWHKKAVQKSRRADVNVDFTAADGSADYVKLTRLDLLGNNYERGYAHGALMAKEIVEFVGPKLTRFYMDEVLNIDLDSVPEPLKEILRVVQVKGALAAPEAFRAAMSWVWQQEQPFIPAYFVEEIDGMAAGMCSALHTPKGPPCNATQWAQTLQQVNMLPELIRMACTAYGAWGHATPTGEGLVQLRALDFGSGPFANYTLVSVNRNTENGNAFVSVSFPGFVGVITGISQSGVGVSEKVWMTYDKRSLQPGSYDGVPDVFALRHILQNAKNRADAEAYLQSIRRTWAIWVGVGDYESRKFDLVAYRQADVTVLTDETAPTMTGQPYLEHVAYVDKHPQPSGEGPTGTLPTALKDFYGNITLETSKIITQHHRTGDVHIATYDYVAKEMYLAIGKVDHKGNYGPDNQVWKAYNRPYLKFDLAELWRGL